VIAGENKLPFYILEAIDFSAKRLRCKLSFYLMNVVIWQMKNNYCLNGFDSHEILISYAF
jgi:hypothetical protein